MLRAASVGQPLKPAHGATSFLQWRVHNESQACTLSDHVGVSILQHAQFTLLFLHEGTHEEM